MHQRYSPASTKWYFDQIKYINGHSIWGDDFYRKGYNKCSEITGDQTIAGWKVHTHWGGCAKVRILYFFLTFYNFKVYNKIFTHAIYYWKNYKAKWRWGKIKVTKNGEEKAIIYFSEFKVLFVLHLVVFSLLISDSYTFVDIALWDFAHLKWQNR